jgi:hypothetical protein
MRNCQIYNNTFYNSLQEGANIGFSNHHPGFVFTNNVFVYNGSFIEEDTILKDEVFQGNLYWNLAGNESFQGHPDLEAWAKANGKEMTGEVFAGIYMDPLFINPGQLDITDPEGITPEALQGYFPGKGSPLIDAGLNLQQLFDLDPGSCDLVGTVVPVNTLFDIGAIEASDK